MADMSAQSSSPDPLANSLDDSYHRVGSPSKSILTASPLRTVAGARPSRRHIEKREAAKSAQKPTLQLSTPTKSRSWGPSQSSQHTSELILHTPTEAGKGHDNSPWRIRVTVEKENCPRVQMSPSHSRTRTTKVPLKDADESKPARRRGRPRKSDIWAQEMDDIEKEAVESPPKPNNKRKRKSADGAKGRKRRQSGFVRDLQDTNETQARALQQDDEHQKSEAGTPQTSTASPLDPSHASPTKSALALRSPEERNAPQRKIDFSSLTPLHKKPENAHLVDVPDFADHDATSMKSLKGRIPTPRKPSGWRPDEREQDDNDDDADEDEAEKEGEHMTTIDPSTATNLRNDGLRIGDEAYYSDDNDDAGDGDGINVNDDPELGAQDDTVALDRSLAESEGFSMVSIESLRSQKEQAEREARDVQKQIYSQGSGLHLSSQPQREMVESLSSAEPTNVVPLEHRKDSEDAVDPSSGLFGAFGHGTQRALRSSLHMGELMARSDHELSSEAAANMPRDGPPSRRDTVDGHLHAGTRLLTPPDSVDHAEQGAASEHQTHRNSVQRQDLGYDEMSWRPSTLPRNAVYPEMSWRQTTPAQASNVNATDGLTHTQRAEQRYAQERRRVSQQIEEANTSQVIVVDSSSILSTEEQARLSAVPETKESTNDDEDIEMLDANEVVADPTWSSDIWQAEADRSFEDSLESQRERHASVSKGRDQTRPQHRIPTITSQDPTPDFRGLFPTDDPGPQRGKIPRSWRRVSGDSSFLYSDESIQQEASPPRKAAFKSPGLPIQPSLPTVFKRWAAQRGMESHVTQKEESVASSAKKTPRKSILSTPDRRASSPAKEVRFAEEDNTYAESIAAEEEYYSSSSNPSQAKSSIQKSIRDEETQLEEEESESSTLPENGFAHASSANDSVLDTSDVRQLKHELRHTTASANSSLMDTSDARQLKCELRADDNTPVPAAAPGLFSRLVSWLYPPEPTPTYANDQVSEPVREGELVWTRNHYLLLDNIYRSALCSKPTNRTRKSRLPPSFYLPLPATYHSQIGKTMTSRPRCSHGTTPPRKGRRASQVPCSPNCAGLPEQQKQRTYEYTITQTDMRVVHAFCDDARDRGIPQVGHPGFDKGSSAGTKGKSKDRGVWPVRDVNGRILRVKEQWDVDEVVRRVYSLWVGDQMRDEDAQGQ